MHCKLHEIQTMHVSNTALRLTLHTFYFIMTDVPKLLWSPTKSPVTHNFWNRENNSSGQARRLEKQRTLCVCTSPFRIRPSPQTCLQRNNFQHLPELCQCSHCPAWATRLFFPSTSKGWLLACILPLTQEPSSPDTCCHLPAWWTHGFSLHENSGLLPRKMKSPLPPDVSTWPKTRQTGKGHLLPCSATCL